MTVKELPNVPDAFGVEPVIGWRKWDVGGRLLRSPVYSARWPACEPMVALAGLCIANFPTAKEPTPWRGERHTGIFAHKVAEDGGPLAAYETTLASAGCVLRACGTVALWGRVFEHEYGWRAEYAYPQELWVIPMDHPPHPFGKWQALETPIRDAERAVVRLRAAYRIPVHLGPPPWAVAMNSSTGGVS